MPFQLGELGKLVKFTEFTNLPFFLKNSESPIKTKTEPYFSVSVVESLFNLHCFFSHESQQTSSINLLLRIDDSASVVLALLLLHRHRWSLLGACWLLLLNHRALLLLLSYQWRLDARVLPESDRQFVTTHSPSLKGSEASVSGEL
ncbi:hypothetical protein QN277_008099 [Acacia crassicarpa]|uniref:Uncharacterized protein n=1 Tax=Acacia crassicarpa TaxID=499986 RepID=A0AAE1IRI7_9FABA|nr:hypothetical protein QN277_008099 [Acacia crassicarpa]